MEYERRTINAMLRATQADGKTMIEGQSAVFGQYSEDLGGWVEIIEPGFFDDVLSGDTRALFNHDPNYVLGRTTSGTLELSQDEDGLNSRIYPPETSYARDLLVSIQRGDISQQSFAFTVKREANGDGMDGDEWAVVGDVIVRRLKKGGAKALYDVSPVTYPAYPQTNVSADTRTRFEEFRTAMQPKQEAPGGAEGEGEAQEHEDKAQARLSLMKKRLELAEKS